MALAVGGVACAREAKSPDQAPASTTTTRGQTTAPDPPPAAPATVASPDNIGGVAPQQAELPPAPGPANVVKDEDELAKIGPNQQELEQQAREDAQAAAKEKAKWAKLAHDQDRRDTEEWSRDRVSKAAARAAQLQNQSSRVPPAKRGKFNTDMTTFQTRKAQALSRINSLSATGSEEWKTSKAELDRAIEEMDQALIRLEGDF